MLVPPISFDRLTSSLFQSSQVFYPQFVRQILENFPGTAYIYDLMAQQTIYAVRSLPMLLGYREEDLDEESHLPLATLLHPDDLESVSSYFQRLTVLKEGEVLEIEYRMKRANGDWCWLHSQETCFVEAIEGFPLLVLGFIQDVSSDKNDG